MTWLVTGGAGYIGGHVVRALRAAGNDVVVFDDMSSGVAERVPVGVPLVRASVLDVAALERTIRRYEVKGVVHLAAKKSVPESMSRPLYYYRENVAGFVALLCAVESTGVRRVVLSSTAAVLGTPPAEQVDEDCPASPESPYGTSKLVCEWMVRDATAARGNGDPLHYVVLRYFNVAGAADPMLGDRGISNLIPMTFRALGEGRAPQIFGEDYPTRDGSCVRDYIHVADLARAHVDAAQRLGAEPDDSPSYEGVFNVGRGQGVTVKEVMTTVAEVTGLDFRPQVLGRRAGDPPAVVGQVDRIARELSWKAELDLTDMVSSAWEAWLDNRAG